MAKTSLFSKIKNVFQKKSIPGFSPYIQSQLWWLNAAVYSPASYRTFAGEGYMTNPVVYRCINLIATACAGIPWKLYRKVSEHKDLHIEESPVLDILKKPNPLMSQADFFTDLISYLQMSGNVYVRRVGPRNGAPKELYLLRPDRMLINNGDCEQDCYDDILPTYDYECDAFKERIPYQEIWHGKLWNPLCDFYGMSPLQAAGKSIDQLNLSLDWNVALLQNSANPSGVLTSEGNLTDDQIARLKEQLAVKYQSSYNAGRPMVLEGGLSWSQMSLNPKDMQWDMGVKNATKFISMALGVDTSLLGDASISTYSNFKDAEKAFYTSTVLPNMDRLRDDFLNGWLLPQFPNMEDYYFEYDRDEIEVLGEERSIVWDRALSGMEAGLISLNEARDAIGYSEYDETEEDPEEAEVTVSEEEELKKKKSPGVFNLKNKRDKAQYVASLERRRLKWSRKARKRAVIEFEDEKHAVLEAISKVPPNLAEQAALSAINPREWYKFYKWLYSNVMKDFALATFRSYREMKANNELEEAYLREAEDFMEETILVREEEILETTKERIIKAILAVLALGGGIDEIRKAIEKLYDQDIPIRSRAIAETEVITAGNAGAMYAAKTVGALKKEWIAVMDDRTRKSHRELNGEIRRIDELYSFGLRFPGDPLAPADQTINCRCVEIYYI